GLGTGDWGLGIVNFDTLRAEATEILGSTSPLRLDPLRCLTSEVVLSPSSAYGFGWTIKMLNPTT
ncbi:hypothetical protein, partial [Sphaerospermopsis sp. LEGE 00249]|uniref:hypothetical protein n=1 Tax=Sphaerospermopsis sp. LEGE 00249 TaxID=1380707 RepID=UPI001C9AFDCE